jgi:hypothetical protein
MKRTIVLVVALLACGKKQEAGKASEGDKPKPVAIDPSLFGGACSQDFDCPRTEVFDSCKVECIKSGDKPGYCQLQQTTAEVGAKRCVGNHLRDSRFGTGGLAAEVWPLGVYCDLDHDVYCDEGTTRTCLAVKALGAACKQDDECGKDGACDQSKCVAAGAPGQPVVAGRCNSKARSQDGKCVPLTADGGACKDSGECLSGDCLYSDKPTGVCTPERPPACTITKR